MIYIFCSVFCFLIPNAITENRTKKRERTNDCFCQSTSKHCSWVRRRPSPPPKYKVQSLVPVLQLFDGNRFGVNGPMWVTHISHSHIEVRQQLYIESKIKSRPNVFNTQGTWIGRLLAKVLREIMELLIKCNGSSWNRIFVCVSTSPSSSPMCQCNFGRNYYVSHKSYVKRYCDVDVDCRCSRHCFQPKQQCLIHQIERVLWQTTWAQGMIYCCTLWIASKLNECESGINGRIWNGSTFQMRVHAVLAIVCTKTEIVYFWIIWTKMVTEVMKNE